MTDHANELRRYSRKIGHPAGDVPSVMLAAADEIERLAARLEEAEKSDAESLTMYRKARDERDALRVELNEIRYWTAVAHDTIKALNARIEAAEKERDWHAERCEDAMNECAALRAKIAAMEQQGPVAFGLYSGWALKATYLKEHEACEQRDRRQLTADLGGSLEAYRVSPLYALPGAQPAPSVPREAINKMLTQLMDLAVSNGANSISMPDEYVEVAAWLCGIPAQPAPSVPDADELAHFIRRIDGAHDLGASALAEKIVDWLAAAPEAKP